ncbi:glycoside hydrolase domain-containing protein [Kitasatospora sp. NPDC093102]|uniref:glycoside hydrolase domain-containing protein n=1 Tax=Kitasatospora sp. NPDC093102 TaxID=3155069 RepID=UPI00343F721B
MADEMVLRAQKFINTAYAAVPDIPKLEEDGKTSWTVMYALTRALQYELNITPLSNTFGPTTLSVLESRYPVIDRSNNNANINRIVQSGLYCKGYDGGEIDGVYNSRVSAAVVKLKQHMGVDGVYAGDGLTPKMFKALLTMDPYVVVTDGTAEVRAIQQWMNGQYVHRRNFFIIPCDGHFSRDVQKALMLAIQYQIGMSDDVANGAFGPGTKAGIQSNTLSVGSSGTWVQLFTAAMVFNGRRVAFDSTYTTSLQGSVKQFQSFLKLPESGQGDYQTWASLLVSTGDPNRQGTALDCVTQITPERADALKAAGYQIVGRYLSNVAGTTLNKKIQPGELDVITGKGLRIFPIYQTYGGSANYFRPEQGRADALAAVDAASEYGFKRGTRIYFAVDFDALDYQVTDNIIPHFRAIKDMMSYLGDRYQIGVYGPRNICSRVAGAGLTTASFVSDMSTGFSGNLGFSMPPDWAFDQISTITVGSGAGQIVIDNDIASGRDNGQNTFDAVPSGQRLDVRFDLSMRAALLADIQACLKAYGYEETSFGKNFSTTACVDEVLHYDLLFTSLARNLRIRKALLQVPVLWEMRNISLEDDVADNLVASHFLQGTPGTPRDSSTGLAQIFGATAIAARNYAVRQGVLNDVIKDFDNDADQWEIWKKLNQDNAFTVGTVPYVHMWHASLIPQRRPDLDYTETEVLNLLARYQGTTPEAMVEARKRLDVYRVFEKYQAPMRNL